MNNSTFVRNPSIDDPTFQTLREWKFETDVRGVTFSDNYEKPRLNTVNIKRPTIKLEFQGKFVACAIRYEHDAPPKRGKRGGITTFSARSRTRMFDMFHKLEIKRKPIFVTLTYGEDYPDAKTAKNNLRALFERIRRKMDGLPISAVWRMEFQERGAPHFHIIFFDLPFIDKLTWQYWWEEITGHPEPFTRVERVRSHKQIMAYVSKYVAKIEPSSKTGFISLTYLHAYREKHGDNIGRVWGYFQKDALPWAEKFEYERDWSPDQFRKWHDLAVAAYPPIAEYLSSGFRLYVKDATVWRDIAFHLFNTYANTRHDPPLTI
jgi:hypothetical protein